MDRTPHKLDSPAHDVPIVDAFPLQAPANLTQQPLNTPDPLIIKFLRSFHVLLRSVRLYQRNHPRINESLEAAERDLRAIFAHAPAVCIRIERDAIIVSVRDVPDNGRPLPDPRGEFRVLAVELAGTGIFSLVFLRSVNLGELALLAHELDEASRTGGRLVEGSHVPMNWPEWIARNRVAGLQINSVLRRLDEAVLALLISALPPVSRADAQFVLHADATPDRVRLTLRFLSRLRSQLETMHQQTPQEAAREVRSQIATAEPYVLALLAQASAQDPPLDEQSPERYLSRIGDALAVSFLLAEFRAARVSAAGIRELAASLEAANSNDSTLDAVVDARIERFWSNLSESEIADVISGPDAWCIPVPLLRAHLNTLLNSSTSPASPEDTCHSAFRKYLRCLESEKSSARRAVASGIVELADLLPRLWPHPELSSIHSGLISALACESSPAVAVLLASGVEILARIALDQSRYDEFEQILNQLDAVPQNNREAVQPLARRLAEPRYWSALFDSALEKARPSPALVRLLERDPGRLLDRFGELLSGPRPAACLPALTRLITASGDPIVCALETDLCGARRQRISTAIKLLANAAPERLALTLRRTLSKWEWNLQDLAVTELARQTQPVIRRNIAKIFVDLLMHAHLHVVPSMIDAIALARENSAVPRLVEIACGEISGAQDIFVRIKAIEALGRLGANSAVPRLNEIATKRSGLTHVYPPGLRSAAQEALDFMEGRTVSLTLHNVPGKNEHASSFAQPRRYRRVALSSPFSAEIEGTQKSAARVRAIALGGALVETGSRLAVGDSMQIEIHAGFGRIRSTAVVRNSTQHGYGVEFVHMGSEDREKLRRRMAKLLA